MLFPKLFLAAAFMGSIIWLIADLDYKSISTVIMTTWVLLAIRVNACGRKDKSGFEQDK